MSEMVVLVGLAGTLQKRWQTVFEAAGWPTRNVSCLAELLALQTSASDTLAGVIVDSAIWLAEPASQRNAWQTTPALNQVPWLLAWTAGANINSSTLGNDVDGLISVELDESGVLLAWRRARELRQLRARLLELEQFAALGQIMAGVLHELKTPLNNLLAGIERIPLAAAPDAARWAEVIRRNGNWLRETVTGLLGGLRDSGASAPVCLTALMDQAAEFVLKGSYRGRDVEVLREYAEPPPTLVGMGPQLLHLFVNLILNALQALAGRPGRITLRCRRDSAAIFCAVEDSGGGIPASVLPHVFDAAFSTKERGSGIGLAFAQRIAAQHQATITVRNGVAGAVFTVAFPCDP